MKSEEIDREVGASSWMSGYILFILALLMFQSCAVPVPIPIPLIKNDPTPRIEIESEYGARFVSAKLPSGDEWLSSSEPRLWNI